MKLKTIRNRFFLKIHFLLLIILLSRTSFAQDSSKIIPKRFIPLVSVVGVGYAGALIGLNQLWYSKATQSPFHVFDDNAEWRQMDKFGHSMTAFQESRFSVDLLLCSGVPRKQAILYGGLNGFILQAPIEIFDGFSDKVLGHFKRTFHFAFGDHFHFSGDCWNNGT